jgi:hypothetical protein
MSKAFHTRDPTRLVTWADNRGETSTCYEYADVISNNYYPVGTILTMISLNYYPGLKQFITTRVRDGTMALRMASTRLGVIVLLGLLRRIRKVANLYHMVLCLIV